jgi:hypothetical protein
MAKQLAVLVCDTEAKANDAKKFLKDIGFAEADITGELFDNFSYDAKKFDGGTVDLRMNKFIVTGRK